MLYNSSNEYDTVGGTVMNLLNKVEKVKKDGYSEANAETKLCQDIIIETVSQSSLNRNVTIDYYNKNARDFALATNSVEFKSIQNHFIDKLPQGASILDFGCGSGRDTKYFLEQGFQVEAVDGSGELCKIASEYTGIKIKQQFFQELDECGKYEGIWACSSILHLAKPELKSVLEKMEISVKSNGIIYTSFKYGNFEGERNGRYFTDMTERTFIDLIKDIKNLMIEEQWVTSDVRPGRGEEKWLNLILRKK